MLWYGLELTLYLLIDPYTFNLDPNKIKAALLADTKAILGMLVIFLRC